MKKPEDRATHEARTMLLTLGILMVVMIMSLFIGRYPAPGFVSPPVLRDDELVRTLILTLRMPRLFTALLLGMSLGAAGQVFQMIFANPLVEPGFLGVSQGAAFGASLAVIYLGNAAWIVQGTAALFGFCGLIFSFLLAHRIRFGGWILRLVLAGISVSALFTAGIGVLKFMADPLEQLPEITFWLLGGLWSASWFQLLSIVPVVIPSLAVLVSLRWRLNVLTLGDEVVFSLGVAPGRERMVLLGASVTAVAAVVSLSGIVGWIGLIVPHIARRLFGVDTRLSLPGAMIFGALFTLVCDDMARTVLAGEVPLGILTSLVGAAFFLALMVARRRRVYD